MKLKLLIAIRVLIFSNEFPAFRSGVFRFVSPERLLVVTCLSRFILGHSSRACRSKFAEHCIPRLRRGNIAYVAYDILQVVDRFARTLLYSVAYRSRSQVAFLDWKFQGERRLGDLCPSSQNVRPTILQ